MKRVHYAYTDNLKMQLRQVTKDQFIQIHEAIDFHIDQYEDLKGKYGGVTVAYNYLINVQDIIDKQIEKSDKKPKCHKGCSFCCQINVDITDDEAGLLVAYCAEHQIDIDTDKLERQSKTLNWLSQNAEDRRCQFLDKDGGCKVYDFRPMNCRRHLVFTDPDLCDAIKYPHGEVGRISMIEPEIITTAVMSICHTDSMAKLLINKIKEYEQSDKSA